MGKSRIISYKNREFDESKPFELYRCLNRKGHVYSIKQNGLVVGHTTNITMVNCEYIINKGGKQRSIKEQTRNVHAFVRGMFFPSEIEFKSVSFGKLKDNPYIKCGFHDEQNKPITKSDYLFIGDIDGVSGIFFINNN